MSVWIFLTRSFLRFGVILMAGIFCRVFLAASLIGSFWSVGHAASEAGNAVAVVQSATATGSSGKKTLEAGMPVSIGELIKTGRAGQVQLVFTDDTKLVIGPNSSLVIEAYLLRSESTVSTFAVKALGGSFRFITGKSPKEAYSIQTPTATIGIRGTVFDLAVGRGITESLLFSGEVDLCGDGNCVQLNDACGFARAPRIGDASLERSPERRNRIIRARFPYAVSQAGLLPEFRVSTGSCGDLQEAERESNKSREPRERREPPEPPDSEFPGNSDDL